MPDDRVRTAVCVGAKLRIDFGGNNPNNRLEHVRAIVDDDHVVTRWWSRRRRQWIYKVEHILWYELLLNDGYLTVE
jgi:hypothetical protein